ncbi:hypothetical protein jaqu_21320 [Jannaschia aquimarina]|uniref:Glyoxalase-like domain-containing protein n=1 Tax=Jannaschia aquimarina TaxID=935700 RepID=A0A0D1EK29_9RHOB|nr:hypothetical protein jaqu_21320 [Jannaschia aquimarina]SNT36794.1 Glyoxalase-like domain-containing protein [Jannaschia aquimarina]
MTAASADEGADHISNAIGIRPEIVGRHAAMGTWNRLMGLGGPYLEAITIDPDGTAPNRPRWYALDDRTGPAALTNWALRVPDLEAAVAHVPDAGTILDFARDDLHWRMAVPDDGHLPFHGCFPALIQWLTPPPVFPDSGCHLEHLVIAHPEPGTLAHALHALTDDPAIEIVAGTPGLRARIATPTGLHDLT